MSSINTALRKNKSFFICSSNLEPKTITKMCVAYRKINSHLWCRIEMKHTFFLNWTKWPWNDTLLPYAKVFVTENLLFNSLSIKFPDRMNCRCDCDFIVIRNVQSHSHPCSVIINLYVDLISPFESTELMLRIEQLFLLELSERIISNSDRFSNSLKFIRYFINEMAPKCFRFISLRLIDGIRQIIMIKVLLNALSWSVLIELVLEYVMQH